MMLIFKTFKTSGYRVKYLYFKRNFSGLVENVRSQAWEREVSENEQ